MQFFQHSHQLIADINRKSGFTLLTTGHVLYRNRITINWATNEFYWCNCIFTASSLPLHSAGAVAAHELGHVGNTNTVEVADDRMLQAACRHSELKCRLLVLVVVEAIE